MPPSNKITREIHFYRVDIGLDSSGKPKIFDPKPVFGYIEKISWKDTKKDNRYFDRDGKILACWVHSTDDPCKIALGNIRRSDLPQIETQGELSPLELSEKSGLADQTHIVFLGDNIVGCDSNYYGPKVYSLPFYLSDKALRVSPEYIKFHPLLHHDVYEQFKKFKNLNMLQLRIRASYIDSISQVNAHLASALDSAYRAGETDDVELILRSTTNGSQKGLANTLLSALKILSKRPELREEADKFLVNGYSEEKETLMELNLLNDKLIIKKDILKKDPRSRALNPNAAFDAIISAYNEVKDEIKKAPSVEW